MTWISWVGGGGFFMPQPKLVRAFKVFALPTILPCHQPSQFLPDDWNFVQCKPVLRFLSPPPKG